MKRLLIIILIFTFIIVFSSNASAGLSSDFFFDENYLFDLDVDIATVDRMEVEGRSYNKLLCGCFLFDINNGDTVRNVSYNLIRTASPARNNTYTAWYIKPLDDLLYNLYRNQGSNDTLGPLIMSNLNIIGTGCTDNPTCYASNISSIIHNGSFELLLYYIRPDDRFLIAPKGSYTNTEYIVYQTKNTNTTIQRITLAGPVTLQWNTAYLLNGTAQRIVMTTPVHDVKGFFVYDLFIDTNNSLTAFLILMSIMGLLLIGFSMLNPDYYVKLVLLFFSGFFFIVNFMLTNSFYGTAYFQIASFMSVAYSMMGLVLLGLFIYLFFSMGIIFVVMPLLQKNILKGGGNGKK